MIESWLPEHAWPTAIQKAIRHFRQGHVIAWDSIAYAADFANALCKPTVEAGSQGVGYVRIDATWPYVIVTTQTCDICEEGKKKPRMPWVSVAPVYDILPSLSQLGQAKQIRSNGFLYLVPLTSSAFAGDDTLWVADLRVEYPLEKSVLVGRDPVEAFVAESDYNYFAEKLASRRNRPAIDSRVRDFIIGPLGSALTSGAINHDPILEMRVQCGPKWDRVERVRLFAVVRDGATIEAVEEQFDVWHEAIEQTLPQDLSLLRTKVVEYGRFSLQIGRQTVPVDYSDVSL